MNRKHLYDILVISSNKNKHVMTCVVCGCRVGELEREVGDERNNAK